MTKAEPQVHDLLIERVFPLAPDELFQLWADPGHRQQWWGPKSFTCTSYEADFRVGGGWTATIVSEAWGSSGMHGSFTEIVPGKRLIFTFVWDDGRDQPGVETVVTVTFTRTASGTLQCFHQTPFLHEDARDSHIEGWGECFDKELQYAEEAKR